MVQVACRFTLSPLSPHDSPHFVRTSADRPLPALVAILVLFGLLVLTSWLLEPSAAPRTDVSSEEVPAAALATAE